MAGKLPLFQAIEVETLGACNRACWFCKFGQPRDQQLVQRMSWELIERIVADLRRLEYRGRLSWYKINEPLLDKRIYDILRLSRAELPHAWLSLVSNGDLLDRPALDRLADCGLDVLGVSVYDDATMAKVAGLRSDRLVVLDRRPGAEAAFVENRGGNIRLDTEATRQANATDVTRRNCLRPSTQLTVQPNGQVSLCCCDLYGDVVMGDVATQSLDEIWWGPGLTEVRRRLRSQGRTGLPLCESCTYAGWPAPRSWPLGFGPLNL